MIRKILKALRFNQFFFGLTQFLLIITGFIPSNIFRKLIYKYIFFMKIGKNSTIHHGAKIRSPWKIKIGNNTIIGDAAILDGRRGITIGDNVNFSTGVWIWTLQHDLNSPKFETEGGPVVIEDYAWISCRTIILPGVHIGKGVVIAAGSVVTKSINQFKIAAGIPAKEIGCREKDLEYKLKSKIPIHIG